MKHHKQYEATRHRISAGRLDLALTLVAGGLIILLTAVAFWLSYAHLHDVAHHNGLGGVRGWAWPSTLDAFVVIGEVLMLRAGLRHVTDWWAVAATTIGSVGSIVLNVVGVPGNASVLTYVVAAVPPTAAMLAFGLLMRQVHQIVGAAVARADDPGTAEDAPAVQPVPADTDAGTPEPAATPAAAPQRPLVTIHGPSVYRLAVPARVVEPEPVPAVPAPLPVICGPAVHRPRVLASDGALDAFPTRRAPAEPVPTPAIVPAPAPVVPAPSAALDAMLAAARAARTAALDTAPTREQIPAEVTEDQRSVYAEETVEVPAANAAGTDEDTAGTPEPEAGTVPVPGVALTDVELDAVVVMLRTETDPPRSFRQCAARFRELGYVGGTDRLRAAWERVSAETATV
ncbi:DUF2637 domain-containing protein [Kitasatospora sp. NPDC018058]|uniref:DUF2637 domain-containing protein n=1 Tax=Kitasatospora sp. NPDC018058 TaxID=3364025 RepID=UPI0037C0E7E2